MVKYYNIEMIEETVHDVAGACEMCARLLIGDEAVIQKVTEEAYFRRIGKPCPRGVRNRIAELARKIREIGWDDPAIVCDNERSRVLIDVEEVLLQSSGKVANVFEAPLHYAKDRELVRVVKIKELKHKRRKK